MHKKTVRRVVDAYDSTIIKAYCRIRFIILRQRFLEEIGQYLPHEGRVLDMGCGFGLFSLYYASRYPGTKFFGIDLSEKRIETARRAADRLELDNVDYLPQDVRDFEEGESFDAIYLLDIVHHIPPDAVEPLLVRLASTLPEGGRLILKDIDRKPVLKRWFTWWLDKAMDPKTPVSYWEPKDLQALLERVGFRVHRHLMVDILPYPHIIYICEKA